MTGMIIISIICISCAFLLWHIADKRGANTQFRAIMGAVLGPFAVSKKTVLPSLPNQKIVILMLYASEQNWYGNIFQIERLEQAI